MKRNVYFAQVNSTFGRNAFLPLSVAMLQAYACTDKTIVDNYDFKGFFYLREPIDDVLDRIVCPDVFGVSLYIWNVRYTLALAKAVKGRYPDCLVVAGGPHVPNRSAGYFSEHPYLDLLVHGEGEAIFRDVLLARASTSKSLSEQVANGLYSQIPGLTVNVNGESLKTAPRSRITDLDSLPSPYLAGVFDDMPYDKYDFHASQETHRGCPYMCLSGDTIINTGYGNIPIKELSERYRNQDVPVFTYDRAMKEVKVSTARNISRTGTDKKLVRVHFDDGTHIDCTPDHKFLAFKWGSRIGVGCEWEVEAGQLTPGTRLRAIRWEWGGEKRDQAVVCSGRRFRAATYRLIAEWMIGRRLTRKEHVHHKDKNRFNNHPENLEVVSSAKEHAGLHPEHAQRMRDSNPTKFGLSEEWRQHIGDAVRGRKRSEESRERYRLAAIKRESSYSQEEKISRAQKMLEGRRAKKNARFTGNHKVVLVEELPGLHDVYCMEVPETRWFYANDVLVHNCSFCDWGSNTMAKVKQFGDERLLAEVQWCADHKVDMLYNCDANYGLFERDIKLTEAMVAIKRATGYPKKFRAAYAKNSNDRVYQIATMLNDAGMNKGVTLSFQSMDDKTLEIVRRKNIKVKDFQGLMEKYRRASVPTYSEIIIGLPGETYDSFADGLQTLMDCGQHDSIQVYTCEMLPNSEMSDPAYIEKHKIRSVETPVLFFHGTPTVDPQREYYHLVVETATLPHADWMKCQMYSWVVQCFHCLSLTQCIAVFLKAVYGVGYRRFYEGLLAYGENNSGLLGRIVAHASDQFKNLASGKEWGIFDRRFGDVVWPVEEGSFLEGMAEKSRLYDDIQPYVAGLSTKGIAKALVDYQKAMIVDPYASGAFVVELPGNVHEVVQAAYVNESVAFEVGDAAYLVKPATVYDGDLERYAREVVWYGRKGGRFQHTDIARMETCHV